MSTHSESWWVGRLAMALALAAARGDKPAKETLQEFLRSPLPSTQLKQMLKKELKT